jgi:hypothetical protein
MSGHLPRHDESDIGSSPVIEQDRETIRSRITVILTEGFSDGEIAFLCGVGRTFYGADIRYASPDGGPLMSAGGLSSAWAIRSWAYMKCLSREHSAPRADLWMP